MQLRQLSLALPGNSLADISPDLDPRQAANLLASWTALWHPTLLAEARRLPKAIPANSLAGPRDPEELALLPEIVPDSLREELDQEDKFICCTSKFETRRQVISHLAENLALDISVSPGLEADFYALGFAYLQMELLTQRMQYNRSGNEQSLAEAVLAAADAAMEGDESRVAERIVEAYDQLTQSRNHYYPIDFYLVDLSLTAPSTVGEAFAQECRQAHKKNVLLSGEMLEHLAQHQPDSLAALRQAVQERRVSVCGGTRTATPLAGLGPEQLVAEVVAAQQTAEELLERPLRTFAHQAGPLTPTLPSMLHKLGFNAVVLANFSGLPMPDSHTTRTTWTGLDGTRIEALAAQPLDMGSASTLLALPTSMQNAMNYDLGAAMLLVGWPGHRTESYHDLMQVARRSTLLGRPITLDEYFEVTTSSDFSGPLSAESYPQSTTASPAPAAGEILEALAQVAGLADATPESFATLLGAATDKPTGRLQINASSVPRLSGGAQVPGFGWRWVPDTSDEPAPERCEPGVLRNERMELVFDSLTGGISATRLHDYRGNFMSQQLVIAPLGPQGIAAGLQLAVDGWQVLESSPQVGRLQSKYRIVDRNGNSQANVVQTTSLAAHSQEVQVEVALEITGSRPPSCALASRIAVREEDFCMTRGVGGVDLPTLRSSLTTRQLGIPAERVPMAVITDMPRKHRRHSGRMLDTVLFEAASESTSAALSYWLDCRHPAHLAAAQTLGHSRLELPCGQPTQPSGWWLHWGATNLLATHLATETRDNQLLVRLRVLETAGRAVQTRLQAWQPIVAAEQTNFRGQPDQVLKVDQGAVQLHLAAYELAEIEFLIDRP